MKWKPSIVHGGYDAENGIRKFYVRPGHSLVGLYFSQERINGELISSSSHHGPGALDEARRWCESRLNVRPSAGEAVTMQFVREADGNIRQDQRQALADARLHAVQPAQKGLRAWEQAQEIQRVCHVDFYAALRLQERFGATVSRTDDSPEKSS